MPSFWYVWILGFARTGHHSPLQNIAHYRHICKHTGTLGFATDAQCTPCWCTSAIVFVSDVDVSMSGIRVSKEYP